MSRQPRVVVPHQPLHIVQRGNNRADLFYDESDFAHCYTLLKRASQRTGCRIHSYVMMHNHFHLLVTPTTDNGPAKMMQSVGVGFVRYFNHRNKRTGTLWEGRYRSNIVQSGEYFFACSRYIELNPVRAGIAEHPAMHKWSSFNCNAMGQSDALITPHPIYQDLAHREDDRRMCYQQMFRFHLEDSDLEKIRNSTNTGNMLGPSASENATAKRATYRERRNQPGSWKADNESGSESRAIRYPVNIHRRA